MCVYVDLVLHCCACLGTPVLLQAATSVSSVGISAMEAIAHVRAKTKAKAKPKKMRSTPTAKAASDRCADLAAYNKEGDANERRSILNARKQEQADKMMHHKQSVTIPDHEGFED